jgi:hypothetical protein
MEFLPDFSVNPLQCRYTHVNVPEVDMATKFACIISFLENFHYLKVQYTKTTQKMHQLHGTNFFETHELFLLCRGRQ